MWQKMASRLPIDNEIRQNIQKALEVVGSKRLLSRKIGYTPNNKAITNLLSTSQTIHKERYKMVLTIINGDKNGK